MPMITVNVESAFKEYLVGDFKVIALDDIHMTVERGQFVAIKGPSGAGKTTLLNVIASLDKPTRGKIQVNGVDVAALNEKALVAWRATNVGFVFQAFHLISTLTAMENVIFPALFWNQGEIDLEERATLLLERVTMSERADHLPVQLSAGEQQRVALARALMNDPPIIIADEPTANLDERTSTMIATIFKELKVQERKTIIVASHDGKLLDAADAEYTMASGRLARNR